MATAATPAAPAGPDWGTLAAIALVAGALTTLLHEGVGHGGACWLSGGHNLVVSSVNEECSVANPWISAAGTLVNFAAGGVFFGLGRRARHPHLRYFLWLAMVFNLLSAAGYWLFSGVLGVGDWADLLAGLQPAWLWRTGMALGGAAVYVVLVRLVAWELKPLLPRDTQGRVARARRLMLVPYFAHGVLSCIAGLFNPVGAVLIAESAAAASFGGASGLCWGWQFVRQGYFAQPGRELGPLTRNWGWIAAGVVAAGLFIGVLGPGLRT
ncbi:MAG TPA: hypothetical protein VNF74_13325 [Terriglobales bacterium]|nr:hypothetical protein [Terriglobales bacterium]